MAPGLFAALAVVFLTLLGTGPRYYVSGDLNALNSLLSLFFPANLLVCYWETCLFPRSNRSRFITLVQAATKSFTNLSRPSSLP